MSVGARAGVPCRGFEEARLGNGDGSIGWNVGRGWRERGGEEQGGGGCLFRGVDAGGDGAGWRRWWRGCGVVKTVMMMMMVRGRGQEEADRWSVDDLIENCRFGSACGFHVRAGISCGGCAEVLWLVLQSVARNC